MTNNQIKKILKLHYIGYEEFDGKIYAKEIYTINGKFCESRTNVTGWGLQKLKNWLGY